VAEEKVAEEKVAEEKAVEEKAVEEKAAVEQAAAAKAADEKSSGGGGFFANLERNTAVQKTSPGKVPAVFPATMGGDCVEKCKTSSPVEEEAQERGEEGVSDSEEDGNGEEEENGEEDSHGRMAAELASVDDATLEAARGRRGVPGKRSKKHSTAEDEKERKHARRKACEKLEEDNIELEAKGEYEDDSDLDGLDEFIASDEEAEAEVQAADRLAAEGEATAAAEDSEEEESAVTRVIRNRLGAAWIVADRSAPSLEDATRGTGVSPRGASKRCEQLQRKLKRERELEAAAAAEASVEASGAATVDLPLHRVGYGGSSGAVSRLFAAQDQSLSSFSVLSVHTLGAAPAPKRQASGGSLSRSASGCSVKPPPIAELASPGAALGASTGSGATNGPSGGATTFFSAATRGMAAGSKAVSVGGRKPDCPPDVSAAGVGGPKPVIRFASFQDQNRYSSTMLGQLGGGATTSSRAFVFRHDKSSAGQDEIDESTDAPGGGGASASAGEAHAVRRAGGGGQPTMGGVVRTPRVSLMSSKGGLANRNALGKSMLATVLNSKSFGRTQKARDLERPGEKGV
jgi:hypothetical protein